MDKKKIPVKNANIKSIFEKMEYGEVFDSTDLAKSWLHGKRKEIYAYIDAEDEALKGPSVVVSDVNTGENMCTVFTPVKSDVEKIILSAKKTNSWLCKKHIERAILINRLAEEIHKNSNLFCQLEISLRSISSVDTKTKALPLLVDYLRYYSSLANNAAIIKGTGLAVNFIADNSFVGFLGCSVGAALAAGHTLILQAAPKMCPLVLLIIKLAENVGIPQGTLKLLPGNIDDYAYIFQNENVSPITVFGNISPDIKIPIGKHFLAITNGKSPMIIFNSGDIDAACDSVIDAAWGYQGLLPWSVNRLLVQEDIFQEVTEKLKYKLTKIKMGLAVDKTADLVYPCDRNANKQLHMLINEAKLHGIEVFQNKENLDIFQPTLVVGGRVYGNNVIKDDDNTAVVTIVAFRTTSEAINLANNTRYGFGASVWTENIGLANEVAKSLNVGNVWINSHGLFMASATFSPCKKSGRGHFGGLHGFIEYLDTSTSDTTGDATSKTFKPLKIPFNDNDKNVYKCPVGSDFHNIVLLAKKANHTWSKTTQLFRSQLLRTVANAINNINQSSDVPVEDRENTQALISLMYSLPNDLESGRVISYGSFNIQNFYDPVGVVVIEAPDNVQVNLVRHILGSILIGNSVIVLCFSVTSCQFFKELLRSLSQCNITPGVLSVITDCNDNVIKSALTDRELDVYIGNGRTNFQANVGHMQRFYTGLSVEYFSRVALRKNVWLNIGDSVL